MYLYLFPLAGCALVALGGWSFWKLWWSAQGHWPAPPSLGWRLGALVLGARLGWFLANLEYSPDPGSGVVGFPMPVLMLQEMPGRWAQPVAAAASVPVLLNLAVGIGLASLVLHAGWKLAQRVPVTRRTRRLRRVRLA
jgi:hypothetical protein